MMIILAAEKSVLTTSFLHDYNQLSSGLELSPAFFSCVLCFILLEFSYRAIKPVNRLKSELLNSIVMIILCYCCRNSLEEPQVNSKEQQQQQVDEVKMGGKKKGLSLL